MDCEYTYDDIVHQADSDGALKTIRRSRKNSRLRYDEKDAKADEEKKRAVTMSPSEYIEKMTIKPETLLRSSADSDKYRSPVFTPNPKIVVFQKFTIDYVYTSTLTIRNTSKVPHQLRLVKPYDLTFSVAFKGSTLNTRLAPGMLHTYEVEFHPEKYHDYSCEVEFKTDLGSFLVPVIAVGPRALLTMPDQIDMETTGLKVAKTKPILLQNIGDEFTGFGFSCDNPCFTVTPEKGSLHKADFVQIQVHFKPTTLGCSHGKISLRYENGDTVQSIVFGEAVKCDVWIKEPEVRMDHTYLELGRTCMVEIVNDSEYLLTFEWVRYPSVEEDLKVKEEMKRQIDLTEELAECEVLPDCEELISRQMYLDRCELIDVESLEYSNEHFEIIPMKSEVWPKKSTMVTVTFEPKSAGEFATTAYLEVDGSEDRLPLNMYGRGLGPSLELNLLSLDVGEVYLCSCYSYQIVCKNSGPITGTLEFVPKSAEFGSSITVEPSEIKVEVGKLRCMRLDFISNRTGNFIERVDFVIKESSENLSFVMKGTVICPLVRIDNEEIIFNNASLGFTSTKKLSLRNLSHSPIEYSIRVPSDGHEPAVTHEAYAKAYTKPLYPAAPREFQIKPWDGCLKPDRILHVQVSYTPNMCSLRDEPIELHVQMCRSMNAEPLVVQMRCYAKPADFVMEPKEIHIRFCFVNFPYCRKIKILNVSNVEGYWYILPQEVYEGTAVVYSLSENQGYLKAGESQEITMKLVVKREGVQRFFLNMLNLGAKTPIAGCEIFCTGEGPVMSTEPAKLEWGEVALLYKNIRTLELINDSPIPAEFKTSFSKSPSLFEVDPASGELEPNESTEIDVSVLLKDSGKFTDHLLIYVGSSKTISVPLSAIGVGTSIVFDPEIFPTYDMGVVFSRQDIKVQIKVRNEGNRRHSIYLTTNPKGVPPKKDEEPPKTFFRLQPYQLELLSGAEEVIECSVRHNVNEQVIEQWYVFATIEGLGKRELLGVSTFTATFTAPKIIFDKDTLYFRVDLGVNYERFDIENELTITNETNRDMYAHLSIDSPFVMLDRCGCHIDYREINLVNLEPVSLTVKYPFDKASCDLEPKKYCGYLTLYYDDHKHVDRVLLLADVNFPHLAFDPCEVHLYCPTGICIEQTVKVTNDSPLTVYFNVDWIKESFRYESLEPLSEGGSEEMKESREKLSNAESVASQNSDGKFKFCGDSIDNLSFLKCDMDYCEDSGTFVSKEIDLIDRFLRVEPREGTLGPQEQTDFIFTMNGFENAKIFIQAKIEIKRGKTLLLNVYGVSDTVRCTVQDFTLDYGFQIYCESAVTTLKIINQCRIPLHWHIELSTNILQIIDGEDTLEPLSDKSVTVLRRASPPGYHNEKLFLEVTYLDIFIINVRWLSTIPQINLDTPRASSAFEKFPNEYGYGGVQILMSEFPYQEKNFVDFECSEVDVVPQKLVETKDDASKIPEFTEFEFTWLIDKNWDVITDREWIPSVLDTDMAFERYIVKDFIQNNQDIFSSETDVRSCCLPTLMVPGYVIDLGYVTVDDKMQHTVALKNYGYEKAKLKMRKEGAKRKTPKACFQIELARSLEICQCESSFLNLQFWPQRDVFTDRETEVSYRIMLDVKRGVVIPVTIKATACYPYLTSSSQTLNFEEVHVGECREMAFRLKNEGVVDCSWEIDVEKVMKNSTRIVPSPFYLLYTDDSFAPGQSAIVKVYFKPYKNGFQKRDLIITINGGRGPMSIKLVGYGIKQKLNIEKSLIKFRPTTPKTKLLELDIKIENTNNCTLELYWQHLADYSVSNRILRVLKHYYQTDDILIPLRKVGDTFPKELVVFHDQLLQQMFYDSSFEPFFENILRDLVKDEVSRDQIMDLKHTFNHQKIGFLATDVFADVNQNDLENLLHAYIDKIQANQEFISALEDPLTEMYGKVDLFTPTGSFEHSTKPVKKFIAIFYGAPFTEYQETACRCARALNLPLLNLDNVIVEATSLGETSGAKKVAQQIEVKFKEILGKIGKFLSGKPGSTISLFPQVSRLPQPQDFALMDLRSIIEYKVDLIESMAESDKTTGKVQEVKAAVPGVTAEMIKDILKDRLAQPKYRRGYVLQTLNCTFLKDHTVLLRMLLDLTDSDDTHVLVTFHNSFDLYEKRMRNLKHILEKEQEMKEPQILDLAEEYKLLNLEDPSLKDQPLTNPPETEKEPSEIFIENSEEIIKMMNDYKINFESVINTIVEWEDGKPVVSKAPKSAKGKIRQQEEVTMKFPEKVFFWHIQSDDPWSSAMYDSTVTQIKTAFFDSADNSVHNFELPQMLLPTRTYSILKELVTQPKSHLHEIFNLSPQIEGEALKSAPSATTIKSHKSFKSYRESDVSENTELESPWILNPFEFRKFKIQFIPPEEGRYKTDFSLGLLDNADASFKIEVEGVADVPRIDMTPEVVFDKVKCVKSGDAHDPCFFVDTQTYDFGSFLVLPDGERKHRKKVQFRLQNISIVPVTLFLSLSNEKIDNFHIHPPVLDIDPGEIGILNVTATTLEVGFVEDELILTVKNNSQPETIKLRSKGTLLNIQIDPSVVNLGRLLLFSTEKQYVTVENRSAATIFWHLRNAEPDQRLRFSPTFGRLKYKGTCDIQIQYYASKICPSEVRSLYFEIFLGEKDAHPVSCEEIKVVAETYQIMYDLLADDLIDFGNIPVHSSANKSIILKNLGPYEFNFLVHFNESEVSRKIRDANVLATIKHDIKIIPKEGTVQPKKEAVLNVTYMPTLECTLKSLPLLNVLIIEPYKDSGVTNEYVLDVSAVTYYTRCNIEPFPSLNFGTLALNATKIMQLKIENTGKFPLKYTIMNVTVLLPKSTSVKRPEDDTISKLTKKSAKQSTRSAVPKNIPAKWGPFTIEKITGDVEPENADTLTVSCSSGAIGNFEEKLLVMVPETFPDSEESRQISLMAAICVADIDLENFPEMFPDTYVEDSITDFQCNEVFPYTIFSKSTKCLQFRQVCMGTECSVCVSLRNFSSVEGVVVVRITDETGVFKVSTDSLTIPPVAKESFKITFCPTELETYRSTMELEVLLPQNLEPKILRINLEGKSYIPQISIVSKKYENESDTPVVDFGLVMTNEVSEKLLKIKNTGKVMAEVSLDINDNLKNLYSLYRVSSEPCGCLGEIKESTYITFTIAPKEISVVAIKFRPKEVEKSQSNVIVTVENNPYETYYVSLKGEGFTKPVIFENLKLVPPPPTIEPVVESKPASPKSPKPGSPKKKKNARKHSTQSKVSLMQTEIETSLTYNLDYEKCYLNKMYKINFRILNKTSDRYFKFEWANHQNIVFTPVEGHLGPNNFKEITVTFLASQPTTLERMPVNCMLNEIKLSPPVIEPLWDSREASVSWREKFPSSNELEECEDETFLKKFNRETNEPPCEILPGTTSSIQVLVSALADYTLFECSAENINFESTLMFQVREHKITLKNIGTVNLEFNWDLVMDELYPVRLHRRSSTDNISSLTLLGSNTACRRGTECQHHVESFSSTTIDTQKPHHSTVIVRSGTTVIATGRTTHITTNMSDETESYDSEKSVEKSDLFSSSAEQTDRSTDSWIEGDNWPFTIFPERGTIEPDKSIEFVVKFSPIDVFEYKAYLKCKIDNLDPNTDAPSIQVNGKSYLPYCHFEIENSDYLVCDRRDNRRPVPASVKIADPEIRKKIRVVEFKLLGIHICHTRNITMVNPTTDDYTYRWTKLTSEMIEEIPALCCTPQTGVSGKGKRIKFVFSVIPERIGLYESFWEFEIKRFSLKTLFLVVFNVSEPLICVKNQNIKLDPTSIGDSRCTSFNLLNNEPSTLEFRIANDSLYSEGHSQVISVTPMSGSLLPKGLHTFNVNYVPTAIGEHNFKIKIKVEKLKKSVSTLIKAQVFEIMPKVVYIDCEGQKMNIHEKSDNIVDMGQIILHEPLDIDFKIINAGQVDFSYRWDFKSGDKNGFELKAMTRGDKVPKNSHEYFKFNLTALDNVTIQNHPLILKIDFGPTYRIKLCASAKKSPLEFSFSFHNFGSCYIQTQSRYIYSVDLLIKNNQKIPCLVECSYKDTSYLQVDKHNLTNAIPRYGIVKVPIFFEPLEERMYEEVICFSTTKCSTVLNKDVTIHAEGISYKVHLKNTCDAIIDVGAIPVGKFINRKVTLVNDGCNPVCLKVILDEVVTEDPVDSSRQKCEQPKIEFSSTEHSKSASTDTSEVTGFLQISPVAVRSLKPNKELDVNIKFKAIRRVKTLKAKLAMQVDSSVFPLLVFKGKCTSASFYLNRNYISFGTIFQECSAEEKFILINDGDVGSKFSWDTSKMKPYFSVSPSSGYLEADGQVIFTCVFKPTCELSCIQAELVLKLEEFKNLNLTVIGNCKLLPDPEDTLYFFAKIRKSETKSVELYNDTNQVWQLKPIILGECFETVRDVVVNPKERKTCDITYKPQKKTLGSPNIAKLVVPLPDAKLPIVYSLSGSCETTQVSEKIVRKVPVFKKIIETVMVSNISDTERTFDCTLTSYDTKELPNVSKLVIPAKKQKPVDFVFNFIRQGLFSYKAVFTDNEENYQSHEIEIEVGEPEIEEVIELVTFVRSSTYYSLKLNNPRRERGIFSASLDPNCTDLIVYGLPTDIGALAFKNIAIEFVPLIPGERTASLALENDTGNVKVFYEFHLTAKPACPEKPTYVKANLSEYTVFSLRIKNYANKPCDFFITSDNASFVCSKPSIFVAAGADEETEIQFAPRSFGKIYGNVTANSDIAGEYIFPVVGDAGFPQPQGPFTVSFEAPVSIKFTNIFEEPKNFEFVVDNGKYFLLNETAARLEPDESIVVQVSLQEEQLLKEEIPKAGSRVRTGKLVIVCRDESFAGVKWTYYLKGLLIKTNTTN